VDHGEVRHPIVIHKDIGRASEANRDLTASAGLRARRQELGLTQAQIARVLHVSEATVSRWENCARRPPIAIAEAISQVLGVDPDTVGEWFRGLPAARHDLVGRLPGLGRMLKQEGITPSLVADACGVSSETAAQWLQDRRSLPRQALTALARLTGQEEAKLLATLRQSEADDSSDTLRGARLRRGLTQRQLAERLGVSPPTISHWETGRWRPPRYRIGQLATVLGVAPNDLARGMHWSPCESSTTGLGGNFGEAIRAARRDSGLSKAQLARCVGVSSATIRRWECGGSAPRGIRRSRVAAVLKLQVEP